MDNTNPTASLLTQGSSAINYKEPNSNMVSNIKADTSLDDLIPKELRIAAGDLPPETKQQQQALAQKDLAQDAIAINSYDTVKEFAHILNPNDEEGIEQQTNSNLTPAEQILQEQEEELDLSSPDAIDKLIAGESIVKKSEENLSNEYPWHSSPLYADLLKKSRMTGLKQQDLDKLIEEAADTKVLDTSNYTKKLEEEAHRVKKDLEMTVQEVSRLRQIEKQAHFDLLPETQENFVKPKEAAVSEIKKILSLAGVDVPIHQILNARDRIELTDALREEYITEKDVNTLANYWRTYKELDYQHINARNNAREELGKYLKTDVPDATLTSIITDSLTEFMNKDPRFEYVKEALKDDLSKSPEVTKVIGSAQTNFRNLIKAFNNPSEFVNNRQWLSSIAKYVLTASHTRHIEEKYYDTKKKNVELNTQLEKLAKEYKKLRSSGVGLKGFNNAIPYKGNGNGRGTNPTQEDHAKFEAFLKSNLKLEDIL